MLRTLPNPYPDELLYSVFARYHIRSGNRSFNQTVEELLNYVSHQLYELALPNNLSFFVKNLGPIPNQTVESLISNHTLYSFYRSFLTQPEAFLLKDSMRRKTGKPIFQIGKIPINVNSENRQFLRFCRQCFEEDCQTFGEAYWHRGHQIPGVLVCLVHRIALNESVIQLQEGYLDCHSANPKNCLVDISEIEQDTSQKLLMIAQEIDWLVNCDFRFTGLQWLRSQYQHYLIEQGFLSILPSKTFKFHKEKFADSIFSFYGQDCMELIKPGLTNHAARYFYRCLFACDVEPTIDRVTHILLIKFLRRSLKHFFEG